MDAKDVADLFATATDKIEFYWNFYVVMLLALIGWLVANTKPLPVALRALISVGYVLFVAMNVVGLVGAYTFAEALRTDLVALGGVRDALPETHAVLSRHSYTGQLQAMYWIHAVVGVGVLAAVWRVRRNRGPS